MSTILLRTVYKNTQTFSVDVYAVINQNHDANNFKEKNIQTKLQYILCVCLYRFLHNNDKRKKQKQCLNTVLEMRKNHN